MNVTHRNQARRAQTRKRNRALIAVLALVIFVGMFAQITMLSRISAQQKASQALEQEILELTSSAKNLNLTLNQLNNLERIDARARQLGMNTATESQIRVVNLPGLIENTSTQSAEAFGAEEIQ